MCNLQKENRFLNLSAWEDNEKASDVVIAAQLTTYGMSVIPATSQMPRSCLLHC